MRPPVPIAEYLDRLTRELRFDPQLSRRVRREIEDHLWRPLQMMRALTKAKPRVGQLQGLVIPN